SSHGTFPNRPPTPPGCGRDGRTPVTQKVNFGVRVNRFATRETNEVPSRIHSRESGGGGGPPKSLTNSFTEDHGLRRISSKLQSRASGLPMVSSTSCCSESKEISR